MPFYTQFRTVVTAQQGAKGYVLHDVMERGLDFVSGDESAATNEYAAAGDKTGNNYANVYAPRVFLVRTEQVEETDPQTQNPVQKVVNSVWFVPQTMTLAGKTYVNYDPIAENDEDGCDFEVKFRDSTPEVTGVDDRVTVYATSVADDDGVRLDYEAANSPGLFEHVDVKDGDKIVVLYWARVNERAAVWQGEQDLTEGSAVDDYISPETAAKRLTQVTVNEPADSPTDADWLGGDANQKNQYANGNGRNDNYTVLTYGAKSYTQWDEAHVTTYGFDVTKTETENTRGVGEGNYALLGGAEFSVRKAITATEYEARIAKFVEDHAADNEGAGPTDEEKTAERAKYEQCKVQGSDGAVEPLAFYYVKDDSAKLAFNEVTESTDPTLGNEPNAKALGADYVAAHRFYRYAGDGVAGATASIQPLVDKSAHLYGLNAGTYVLIEEKAPTGYNKLAHPIVVTVTGDDDSDGLISGQAGYDKKANGSDAAATDTEYDSDEGRIGVAFHTNDNVYKAPDAGYNKTGADWKSTVTPAVTTTGSEKPALYDLQWTEGTTGNEKTVNNGGVQVINQTGAELPSTGGIGTTIFYVAGTVLVVGAAVMLVAKRRMGAEA